MKGFIINRFRGDIKLLESGLDWLEQRTGKPVLGVLPYLHDLALDAEDAVALDNKVTQAKVKIFVPLLPHMSNHTDFDPLRLQPNIDLQYVKIGQSLQGADLIIIPGSKNVTSDLSFLKQQGWQQEIDQHLRYGGKVLGICGGFQMLGKRIDDPDGLESEPGSSDGLGWLDMTTRLVPGKQLRNAEGVFLPTRTAIHGYEIHNGVSEGLALSRPMLSMDGRNDGAISEDGQVMGGYLHGLFDDAGAATAILAWAGLHDGSSVDYAAHREQQLDRLADMLERHMDMTILQEAIARAG